MRYAISPTKVLSFPSPKDRIEREIPKRSSTITSRQDLLISYDLNPRRFF